MQVLRDENTALKATVDQTSPTDASEMASLHEQLCKDIASGAWTCATSDLLPRLSLAMFLFN